MKETIFNVVKKAFEGVMFEELTDDLVSQFHHHLGSLLNDEVSAGNIGSFAISNVNLGSTDGPFVRVSVMENESWKHYEFSCKIQTGDEVVESISAITAKEV